MVANPTFLSKVRRRTKLYDLCLTFVKIQVVPPRHRRDVTEPAAREDNERINKNHT
jgi:hypothetical protein